MIGHSTGGAIAIKLCSLQPERVERLVLEDPIGIVPYRDHIPPQTTEALVKAETDYTTETYRAFIARFFVDYPAERYEPFVNWRMRVNGSGEFDRFALASALAYQMIYREPLFETAARLTMPTLLMAGTRDQSTPMISFASERERARIPSIHDAGTTLAARNRSVEFASFTDVGHVPHLEAAAAFRDKVGVFLAR